MRWDNLSGNHRRHTRPEKPTKDTPCHGTSTMIERVAMAITGPCLGRPMDMARAAIEAMREPTDEQYNALSATNKLWSELNSETVWKTYIDAALKEHP